MENIINAREKLDKLIEIVGTRNISGISSISSYTDNLTEEECKLILNMIVFGDWEKFIKDIENNSFPNKIKLNEGEFI